MAILHNIKNRVYRVQERLQLHEDWRIILIVSGLMAACAGSMNNTISLPYPGLLLTLATASLFCGLWFRDKIQTPLLILSAFLLGLALSEYRKLELPTSSIQRETFVELAGKVTQVDHQVSGPTRVIFDVSTADKLTWLIGQRVRLSVRTALPDDLSSDDQIEVRAVLSSSAGRLVPDGFDFDRHNRFNGIAAQGFAVSPISIIDTGPKQKSFSANLENWRTALAQRILAQLEQPIGGIAVALITGQRQYLDQQAANALRDAGLAHILAISGLHMGLITGAAFFLIELLLVIANPIPGRWPPRKIAGVIAWFVGLLYLLISGMSVSTIRAFAMVSIAILAVLTDRRVISLRSVSIAAAIVLILSPEAIFSIGFQMSFAATIGIVVAYEAYANSRNHADTTTQKTEQGWRQKLLRYVYATVATSLVAQIAIAPIALYHFQTLSIIGVVANLVAVPLMAFIIMPSAFVSLVLGLAGLEGLTLPVMGFGLSVTLEMSTFLANLSFSVMRAGPYPSGVLILTGAIFLILMVYKHRVIAISCVIAGLLILMFSAQRPANILIDSGGRIIATNANTKMSIIGGRRGGFRDETWQRYWNMKIGGDVSRLARTCDSRACQISVAGENLLPETRIVRSHSLETTRQACSQGSIVIASYNHRRHCRGSTLFLAIEDIDQAGPVALWHTGPENKPIYRFSNPERLFQSSSNSSR